VHDDLGVIPAGRGSEVEPHRRFGGPDRLGQLPQLLVRGGAEVRAPRVRAVRAAAHLQRQRRRPLHHCDQGSCQGQQARPGGPEGATAPAAQGGVGGAGAPAGRPRLAGGQHRGARGGRAAPGGQPRGRVEAAGQAVEEAEGLAEGRGRACPHGQSVPSCSRPSASTR